MNNHCKNLCVEIKEFLIKENKERIAFDTYCKIKGFKSKEAIFTLKKAVYASQLIGFTYEKMNGNCATILVRNNTNIF